MDLPFAVDSPARLQPFQASATSASSLVTASSQGSLFQSTDSHALGPTIVASPPPTPSLLNHPAAENSDDIETIDFTSYVTVSETDADEVDIVIDAGDPPDDEEGLTKCDVLAVLLSGPTQPPQSQQQQESQQQQQQQQQEPYQQGEIFVVRCLLSNEACLLQSSFAHSLSLFLLVCWLVCSNNVRKPIVWVAWRPRPSRGVCLPRRWTGTPKRPKCFGMPGHRFGTRTRPCPIHSFS